MHSRFAWWEFDRCRSNVNGSGDRKLRGKISQVSDFKDLKVWQKAQVMSLDVHRLSGRMRGVKYAPLRSQLTRAAMSVPANIVESRGQLTRAEECRYLRIALNSGTECEFHLMTARDLGAIREADCATLTAQVVEVRKMLYGLLRYLSPDRRK